MRKRTIVILVVVAVLLLAGIYGWNAFNRRPESLSNVSAAYTVNAADFITEFEKGTAETEKKYLGKVVAVRGTIKEIDKDESENYTVVLGSPESMSAIRCSMDSRVKDRLVTLKGGAVVSIKGTFTGYQKDETGLLGSDIQLNRAVIDNDKEN